MARIRTIKPEFWRHPIYAQMPDDFQLLALSLLTMADDEGYFRAAPALIRGDVQPFRENLGRISGGLAELIRVGWIEVGKHSEQGDIGRIVNFSKHQRVHNPTPSKLKSYFCGNNSGEIPEEIPLEQGTGNREHEGEFHPLQHADRVMEILGMTQSFQNKTIIAAAITAEEKYTGLPRANAAAGILEKALRHRDEGIMIDKFYFEDAKWRTNGKSKRAISAAEERPGAIKQNIIDGIGAEARRRAQPDESELKDSARRRVGSGI